MTTQIFWILLVLIAVALVEWPLFVSLSTELSDTPPENRQEWLHPVIFEPQNKIQLTHSTYQVTTFLDFASFVNGFNNVQNYIKNFKKDIHDPAYFSMITHKSTNPCVSPLLNAQDLAAFMQSAYCLSTPYACMTRLKIDRFLIEVNYLEDLFDVVYGKFLNAINHIDYHPTMQNAPVTNRSCMIPVPVIVLYSCPTLVSFSTNINSTQLHLQGVAPHSQYSDPTPEAATLE